MPLDLETHRALALDQATPVSANGRSNADILVSLKHAGDAPYHPCPEAYPDESVAQGEVRKFADWDQSAVFKDTLRDVYVYRPAGINAEKPMNLIVFQDGAGYLHRAGSVRAAAVLDSLQASAEIEATAAVFINPGKPKSAKADDTEAHRIQRSFEYDSLTPDYGRFLIEEVLPFVALECNLTFTDDPTRRSICGISSGGICAFTVGWQHPDSFRRIISHCGSFTNIRGGHNYPYLIRTTPRKPLRIFMQSGANDAETLSGNWPLANRTVADSLRYAGYDYTFEFGNGGHSLRHGGALFADSLRWLWRSTIDESN
jgi:enterochelin esterase family protein